MSSPSRVVAFRHCFDDFDAFARAAENWHLRFRQLDAGKFLGEMEQVVAGPVVVTRCRFNRRIEQQGTSPRGCRTFGITQPDHVAFRWRRYQVEPGDVMSFADDVEMDCQSEPGFHLFAVTIAEEVLADAARRLGAAAEGTLRPEHVVTSPRDVLRELRDFCGTAASFTPAGETSENALAEGLALELPRLLLKCFEDGGQKLPVLTSLGRRRALRLAMEAIREAADPILTVAELCRLSGASERMLGYAFRECFNMSPKAYLHARRLNVVRRELLNGGASTLIVEVAGGQGFWHMGQFAADYRKMFDELPSETLARSKRRR